VVQGLVGEHAGVARLAFPHNRRLVLSRRVEVNIEAVVRDVRLAADKPTGKRLVPLEHLVKRLEPMQFLGQLAPEGFRVGGGFLPHLFVLFHRADARLGGEFRRRRKQPRLFHHINNLT
jgi:hypothetical protein